MRKGWNWRTFLRRQRPHIVHRAKNKQKTKRNQNAECSTLRVMEFLSDSLVSWPLMSTGISPTYDPAKWRMWFWELETFYWMNLKHKRFDMMMRYHDWISWFDDWIWWDMIRFDQVPMTYLTWVLSHGWRGRVDRRHLTAAWEEQQSSSSYHQEFNIKMMRRCNWIGLDWMWQDDDVIGSLTSMDLKEREKVPFRSSHNSPNWTIHIHTHPYSWFLSWDDWKSLILSPKSCQLFLKSDKNIFFVKSMEYE